MSLVNNNYPQAKYTMSYLEFVGNAADWITETFVLDTTEHTNDFLSMLISMWGVYEISGETIGEQEEFMKEVFNMYKDYYIELVTNYEKSYEYETGTIKTIHRKGTADENGTYSGSSSTTSEDKQLDSELPHKTLPETDYFSYPNSSSKNNSTASGTDSNTTSRDRTTETDETITDPAIFLDLKNKYINQIRNVWHEFASKFKDCFIHLY